jgi:hypothetical protein
VLRWNDEKDGWLIRNRGVSMKMIADKIVSGEYTDILENPSHDEQYIFIINHENYTWAVPFVVEADETIFLKTAYPSRKFHKRYRGRHEKKN